MLCWKPGQEAQTDSPSADNLHFYSTLFALACKEFLSCTSVIESYRVRYAVSLGCTKTSPIPLLLILPPLAFSPPRYDRIPDVDLPSMFLCSPTRWAAPPNYQACTSFGTCPAGCWTLHRHVGCPAFQNSRSVQHKSCHLPSSHTLTVTAVGKGLT